MSLNLLDLPPEVLTNIFAKVFEGIEVMYDFYTGIMLHVDTNERNFEKCHGQSHNAFLQVSKQCYNKAIESYFSSCRIIMPDDDVRSPRGGFLVLQMLLRNVTHMEMTMVHFQDMHYRQQLLCPKLQTAIVLDLEELETVTEVNSFAEVTDSQPPFLTSISAQDFKDEFPLTRRRNRERGRGLPSGVTIIVKGVHVEQVLYVDPQQRAVFHIDWRMKYLYNTTTRVLEHENPVRGGLEVVGHV